jgi:hypothetical protein
MGKVRNVPRGTFIENAETNCFGPAKPFVPRGTFLLLAAAVVFDVTLLCFVQSSDDSSAKPP